MALSRLRATKSVRPSSPNANPIGADESKLVPFLSFLKIIAPLGDGSAILSAQLKWPPRLILAP
jgi:hypothetical protein